MMKDRHLVVRCFIPDDSWKKKRETYWEGMSASQATPQLFFRQAEGLPRAAQRFSLLLLNEGEVYIDDQSAVYYPPDEKNPTLLDASHRILSVFSFFLSSTIISFFESLCTHAYVGPNRGLNGRLYMCSHSLMFDPQDATYPIYKFAFKDVCCEAFHTTHAWHLSLKLFFLTTSLPPDVDGTHRMFKDDRK